MADNIYLNNRLKYHTASRVAISTAQSMMQATNVDGHTVTTAQVWASENENFPKNTSAFAESSNVVGATNDLVDVFKNGHEYAVTEGISANLVGKVFRNDDFPAVELYEAVQMTAVEYSDDQAWEIKNGNNRVMDWCSPTAVKNGVLPVPGYTGIAQATTTDGTTWTILQDSSNLSYGWSLAGGNWQFVYMSGMLTFHPNYIPSKMSFQRIRFTGFKYIGKYLDASINEVDNRITNIQTQFGTQLSNIGQTLMAVKPFEWNADTYMNYIYKVVEAPVLEEGETSTENPKQLGYYEIVTIENKQVYQLTADLSRIENKTYFVKTTSKEVIIPAILFNVFNTATGLAFGDIEYQSDGSTRVVFEDWDNADFTNTNFIGYGFVLGNGSKITMLDLEELKNESSSSSASE